MQTTGGATVTSYNASNVPVTVTGARNSPNGKTPVLPTSATFVNGVATVPVALYSATSQTLTFNLGNGSQTAQATVTPVAGALGQFSLAIPATVTAGVQANATVTAEDQYGNVETSMNSAPSGFTLNGTGLQNGPTSGTASSSVTWSGGVGTVTFTTYKAGTGDSLTASANGGVSNTSGTFDVVSGSPYALTALTASGNQTADAVYKGVVYTFQVTDQYGNPGKNAPSGLSIINLVTDPSNSGSYRFTNINTHTDANGDVTVTVDSSKPVAGDKYTLTLTGNLPTASVTTTVTPGALAQYVMTPSSPVTETSGTAFTVTVTAEDQFGNVETGDNGTVTIYANGFLSVQSFGYANGSTGTVSGSKVTLAGGKASFSAAIQDSSSTDTGTLGVTDGTIAGTTATITV